MKVKQSMGKSFKFLTLEQEKLINKIVKTGQYKSASEFARDAVREKIARLQEGIQ